MRGPVIGDSDQPTLPSKPSSINPMPPSVIRNSILSGLAAKMSTEPVIPAEGTSTVPVACVDVRARIAARPPIAQMCRSMMDRGVGRAASAREAFCAGAFGAAFGTGTCAACASMRTAGTPAETTRIDKAKPSR